MTRTETFKNDLYEGYAEKRDAYPETVRDGEKKRIRIVLRTVGVTCKRSGQAFRFTGQKRQGALTFGDSRYNGPSNGLLLKPRYNILQLRAELDRIVGHADADRLCGVVGD